MTMQGSCLCGEVVFSIEKFQPLIGHCHCSMCRKFHGAAFSTFVEVHMRDFQWQKGKDLVKSYQAENNTVRQFCRICGSSLTFCSVYNYQTIEVSLSCLDTPVDATPDAHIHCESKVEWLTLNDDLPKYRRYRDEGPT